MLTLESVQRIRDARTAGDAAQLRNTLLDVFADFGDRATQLLSTREFGTLEALLAEWAGELDRAKGDLLDRQLLFSHSRYQAACGSASESRGLEAYFVHGDFVDAPRLMQKAELHHEQAAEFAGKVAFPPEAPPAAREMQARVVDLQRAETLRVRGMRLMMQGEFESEAGGLERAVALLEECVTTLRDAETKMPPAEESAASVLDAGKNGVDFIDFAEALLCKTRSDQALMTGNLTEAAEHQEKRAAALNRCQTKHLRAGQPLNDGFARRLSRDAYVAQQRHDRLAAAAKDRPRDEWRKALVFFGMALGSAALFLWLAWAFDLAKTPVVLGLLLAFVMAIAGVGARLVQWQEAATWLRPATSSDDKKDE
jgi:hypothetical protein